MGASGEEGERVWNNGQLVLWSGGAGGGGGSLPLSSDVL